MLDVNDFVGKAEVQTARRKRVLGSQQSFSRPAGDPRDNEREVEERPG